jgi:hypothetical protein
MKLPLFLLLNLIGILSNAQQISLRAAKSLAPADQLSIRYEHWSNSTIHFCLGTFMERSQTKGLNHATYGIDLIAHSYSGVASYEDGVFGLRGGLGVNWQFEHEPWLYRNWSFSKKSSFGLTGEITGCWYLTDVFSMNCFFQQKILFNQLLGRSRIALGLELAYRLGL